MTFKVGDRVRLTEDYSAGFRRGDEATVKAVPGGDLVRIVNRLGQTAICYSRRLELTPPDPSDKELADEYRRLAFEMKKVRSALVGKGYSLIVGGAQPPKFRKMVTEEI